MITGVKWGGAKIRGVKSGGTEIRGELGVQELKTEQLRLRAEEIMSVELILRMN